MAHTSKPRVVKCLECGLEQVLKSEQPPELEQLYEQVVDADYLKNIPAKRRTFARAYVRLQSFLPARGRLLEIGSYCGLFLQQVQGHGWNVLGIEPSRWAAEYSRRNFGLEVLDGTLEMVLPSLSGGFDAIASWDVLEHVRDPRGFLATAHSLLRPGGVLAISTLDIDSWFPRALGRRWPWIMEMHLCYFGAGVLEHMFREAGFEVLRIEPYRHYASLRYIYRKLCAALPGPVGRVLGAAAGVIPELIVPVSLGDIKLYVGRKI
jgi:2-polyprenyl-3-methyl-5-hydroxy-6-metoxy-1,4-benzoquinol methylase